MTLHHMSFDVINFLGVATRFNMLTSFALIAGSSKAETHKRVAYWPLIVLFIVLRMMLKLIMIIICVQPFGWLETLHKFEGCPTRNKLIRYLPIINFFWKCRWRCSGITLMCHFIVQVLFSRQWSDVCQGILLVWFWMYWNVISNSINAILQHVSCTPVWRNSLLKNIACSF